MPEDLSANNAEKPKQNDLNDPEILKLRDAVLRWLEKTKNISPTIDDLKAKKKKKKEAKEKEKEIEIKNPIAQVEAVRAPKPEIPTPILPTPSAPPIPKEKPKIVPIEKKSTPVKLEVSPGSDELSKPRPLKKSKDKPKGTIRPIFGGKGNPPLKRIPSKKPKTGSKKLIKKILYVILVVIIGSLIILGVSIYVFGVKNSLVMSITKVIPMPVAIVNWQPIRYYSWRTQVDSLENFYQIQSESNPEILLPTPEQTEQHILDRMIDNTILEQEAKKYKIKVSQQEIDEYISTLVSEIGSQAAFESQIKNLYNWSAEDFTQKIVKPLLLKLRLASAITLDDRINEKARLTAQQALNEVLEAKLPFESLAQKYSEDITAVQGGDLGYFSRGQLEPSFEKAAFALNPGEVSELVQTHYGYHIIKVEEVLLDENDEVTQIRAKHILIRGKDLETYLSETKTDTFIWKLISI